jgi:hypothetical protein
MNLLKKDPYILCIIDMQILFPNAQKIVHEVCHQIRQAKLKNYPIILLEYIDNEHTHSEIEDELKNYPFVFRRTKNEDDGSYEIAWIIGENNLKGNILICGVNVSHCITSTVIGLIPKLKNPIHISESATAGGKLDYLLKAADIKKIP